MQEYILLPFFITVFLSYLIFTVINKSKRYNPKNQNYLKLNKFSSTGGCNEAIS
tara:strand:+ start:28 stop:189 length:162 start_codon:yes stop_codon:yes gene_type:complete